MPFGVYIFYSVPYGNFNMDTKVKDVVMVYLSLSNTIFVRVSIGPSPLLKFTEEIRTNFLFQKKSVNTTPSLTPPFEKKKTITQGVINNAHLVQQSFENKTGYIFAGQGWQPCRCTVPQTSHDFGRSTPLGALGVPGCGIYAGYSDEAYAAKGCTVTSRGDTISKSEVWFDRLVLFVKKRGMGLLKAIYCAAC